jgi:23S rRNA-/tRNA-specific pseudouridylate synthase
MEPRCLARQGTLWVLEKPAGLACHRAAEHEANLLDRAIAELGAPRELAAVHRLDRETSGLVLCSSDLTERRRLSGAFADGAVTKVYLALVHGVTHRKGVIRRRLLDARRGEPLPAVTRYRRLQRLGGFSYLQLVPATGRKHQLRRHLQGLGHPVVGDTRYPPRAFRPVPAFPGRLWLHAAELTLPDGRVFRSALPPELADHLAVLGASPAQGDGRDCGDRS